MGRKEGKEEAFGGVGDEEKQRKEEKERKEKERDAKKKMNTQYNVMDMQNHILNIWKNAIKFQIFWISWNQILVMRC